MSPTQSENYHCVGMLEFLEILELKDIFRYLVSIEDIIVHHMRVNALSSPCSTGFVHRRASTIR